MSCAIFFFIYSIFTFISGLVIIIAGGVLYDNPGTLSANGICTIRNNFLIGCVQPNDTCSAVITNVDFRDNTENFVNLNSTVYQNIRMPDAQTLVKTYFNISDQFPCYVNAQEDYVHLFRNCNLGQCYNFYEYSGPTDVNKQNIGKILLITSFAILGFIIYFTIITFLFIFDPCY